MTNNPLSRLVGTWSTEATHSALPGVLVHGTAHIEWLEGERFLIHRARTDHPDFPDSISIIGATGQDRVGEPAENQPAAADPRLSMHYYDSRGVYRVYLVDMDATAWRIRRNAPGFSQRFTGTFSDDGNVIAGLWEMCEDDVHWKDDLRISYHRQP